HASVPGLERDAVLLLGIEPNLRWRSFTQMIVDLARELDVQMLITLGSLLADVPHTRPSPVTGGATDPELIERLGLQRSRYEGPTGIVGVLHDACNHANIPSVSLWAAVPHYVSLAPSPRAALALCERLGDILGTTIDVDELEEASNRYSDQVSEAVASDEETAAYVEELEQRAEMLEDDEELPSGESLAAELTRFLRERDRENGGDSDRGPAVSTEHEVHASSEVAQPQSSIGTGDDALPLDAPATGVRERVLIQRLREGVGPLPIGPERRARVVPDAGVAEVGLRCAQL